MIMARQGTEWRGAARRGVAWQGWERRGWARQGFILMLDFILLVFATYRISTMLTYDSGPWEMFVKLRDRLRPWTVAFDCVRCISVWIGCIIAAAYHGNYLFWFHGLSYSGSAIVLDSIVQYCRAHVQALGGK